MRPIHDPLLARFSNEIRHIARYYGATQIRLFGSRATGAATDTSDIDLLVELEPGRDLFDLIAIKQDVEVLVGHSVDVVEERGLSPYLRNRILAQAIPL